MSTKKIISEQVLFKLAGGYPDTAFQIDERDIWKALEQKINGLFKLHQFDQTLANGETIPENTMIATYEDVAVTSFNGKSKSTLPINPISLPKNVGIFLIYNSAYPDNPFIPIQRGQGALLKVDGLLNDLQGMISYEPKNNIVIYSKDITTIGFSTVTMELCVLDMSQYSITATLPIPADMESRLVDELVESFAQVTAESGQVNNFTTAGQNAPTGK